MVKTDWDNVADFERHPKLSLKIGEQANVTFEDDGNFVSNAWRPAWSGVGRLPDKDALRDGGAKFPRDSHVFVVSVKGEKLEYWVGAKSFSTLRQLKRIRESGSQCRTGWLPLFPSQWFRGNDVSNHF